ncbi:MAG: ABC transporter permease subunit [Actinobacteria bacterium]|nr:ABC transporter permease subunit [Actinomycetota bacterium]
MPSWRARGAVPHLLFGAVIFGTWEAYGRLGDSLLVPPVSAILAALYDLTLSGQLPSALLESATLLAAGLSAALVIGFVFGVITGRSKVMHRTLSPFFNALFVTPTVALVPLVLIWFGFEFQGRVIVVFLAAVVAVLISVHAGIRDAPPDLVDVARSFGVDSEIGLLRHVLLRAAVPLIMSGIRLAVGRAVVGMAVAEVYLRLGGIGALISGYGAVFRTDYLFASILPLPIMGIGLAALVARIERRFQSWRTYASEASE